MIEDLENYFSSLIPNLTFGQIQDEPNNLINFNIYDSGTTPYFKDLNTHLLIINTFVRDNEYSKMQSGNQTVNDLLKNTYNIDFDKYHIVNTKKTGSNEPTRDNKNRYSVSNSFEILIEKVKEEK